MSGLGDEAMDSSAVSEEEVDDPQTDESVPGRSRSKISDVGEIVEGKRAKKAVDRLDFQAPKAKEKLKIADGGGDKLGDIPRTNYEISRRKAEELKLLHSILYDRPGKSASVKKNLRLFNGFPFEAGSPEFTRKRTKMLKSYNLNNTKLKLICTVLDLEKKGTQSDLIDRILHFLIAPKNSGKRAPVKKKRRSKKKLSGDEPGAQRSRTKAQNRSAGAKKPKAGSKSKAIVMDSSSDEEEEEEEKRGAAAEAEGSDGEEKASGPDGEEEEQTEESEESDQSSKPKSSRGKKKNAAEKRQRIPAKKTAPPKKRLKSQSPDESDGDSTAEEKPKKKKVAAAKTKKADSSSNNSNIKTAEDSSDDDEPLIRMIKKAPTDEQLKATVEKLLKEANLEEMTMKQICQKVFDTYPEHDLSSRKDFIKQTVKALIT